MNRSPQKSDEGVLTRVRTLLKAGRTEDALDFIRTYNQSSPGTTNAYGVCLMRAGHVSKAIEVLRSLVVKPAGVLLKDDVPTRYKVNFATALFLDNNVFGCLSVLQEIGDETDPSVVRLRREMGRWKQSLSKWERIGYRFLGQVPKRRP
ncbi:MAG: hypothetical protein PVI86_17585, partial [Phycisphaerae bacterium]